MSKPSPSWIPGISQRVIANVSLEISCHGPSPHDAPTFVLLHEGLGCVELWRDFPQKLGEATGYGVCCYSRAGYGASDPVTLPRPLDYMSLEAEHNLPRVLDAIGFQRGILLGHSDGASIATAYCGSAEDFRIRGLIVIAPHNFTETVGLKAIADAAIAYNEGDLRRKLGKYHRDVDNAFRGWNDAWLDPAFELENISEAIDYLRVPVLAVQGADDQYGTLAQLEEISTRSYSPVDVAILDNCKHSPHVEQPDQLLSLITGFTARLDRLEDVKQDVPADIL